MRLIIADAHVGQGRHDADQMEALVDRTVEAGIEELIYLGDSFQYLIGMEKFWTAGVRAVLEAWQRARSRGVRIVVLEGNRDFFLDEPELSHRVDWTGRQIEFTAGVRRYRAIHGDRVNLRDFQYRFWSAVSKSGPARLWARLLPRSLAVAIVTRMEAKLATTNRKFRYKTPVRDLRRAATTAWSEGIDVLLWGHFHIRWEVRDGDRIAMVVPAWLETRQSMLVTADGDRRWVDADLLTVPPEPNAEPGRAGSG